MASNLLALKTTFIAESLFSKLKEQSKTSQLRSQSQKSKSKKESNLKVSESQTMSIGPDLTVFDFYLTFVWLF